ncbi:MAG TPA: TPM domain-containing protein, partial [Candidatus Fimivivens sp.]|nr:TPM domain-containing protein [Candidatus Fimivivens sp.]
MRKFMKVLAVFLALFLVHGGRTVIAAGEKSEELPKITERITDLAGIISESSKSNLNHLLTGYEKDSKVQIVVLTTKDFAGRATIDEYSVDVFHETGIGRKGDDYGVLITVCINPRKARITTGKGAETELTDVECGRIFNRAKPLLGSGLRNGDIGPALEQMSRDIMADLGPKISAEHQQSIQRVEATDKARFAAKVEDVSLVFLVVLAIVGVGVGVRYLFVRSHRARNRREGAEHLKADFDREMDSFNRQIDNASQYVTDAAITEARQKAAAIASKFNGLLSGMGERSDESDWSDARRAAVSHITELSELMRVYRGARQTVFGIDAKLATAGVAIDRAEDAVRKPGVSRHLRDRCEDRRQKYESLRRDLSSRPSPKQFDFVEAALLLELLNDEARSIRQSAVDEVAPRPTYVPRRSFSTRSSSRPSGSRASSGASHGSSRPDEGGRSYVASPFLSDDSRPNYLSSSSESSITFSDGDTGGGGAGGEF